MSSTQVVQIDSIEEEERDRKKAKKIKSRRPANTAFRQQRLKAWQPILTPKTVLPIFFAIGVIFAPIGGLLLWASYSVQELVIDYTDCRNLEAGAAFAPIPSDKVSAHFKSSNFTGPLWKTVNQTVRPPHSAVELETPVCYLQFEIPNDIGPAVYLYYRLTNFYQNHRRYVKSLDTDQLKGSAISAGTIGGSACNPIKNNGSDFPYYPCGLIANSIFNDTFLSPHGVNPRGGQKSNKTYHMTTKGIAWDSDASLYKKTQYKFDEVAPPPNWQRRFPNGYTNTTLPNLSEYEEFQVWMRTAGLPKFSKLALRNDNETMTAGFYSMQIYDYFPVHEYGGTKSILLSTKTVVGGKNPFLGIAYVVIGGLCIVLGVLFTIAHLVRPRKLGDHTYLSWNNNDGPSTATTTGRDARPGTA